MAARVEIVCDTKAAVAIDLADFTGLRVTSHGPWRNFGDYTIVARQTVDGDPPTRPLYPAGRTDRRSRRAGVERFSGGHAFKEE